MLSEREDVILFEMKNNAHMESIYGRTPLLHRDCVSLFPPAPSLKVEPKRIFDDNEAGSGPVIDLS
jgi:hypothetical protein